METSMIWETCYNKAIYEGSERDAGTLVFFIDHFCAGGHLTAVDAS